MEVFGSRKQDKRGLYGSELKMIAVLSMLIDHATYVFLGNYLVRNHLVTKEHQEYLIYRILRDGPGRIAFPMICFLLVEGFLWTRNRWKYAGRLLLFAFLSEIPFDLAFYHRLKLSSSNVFFTLFFSMLMMMGLETIMDETAEWKKKSRLFLDPTVNWILYAGVVAAAAGAAELIHSDYGARGVLAVFVLYFFRFQKTDQLIAGLAAFVWQPGALVAFLPIFLYNGKRGKAWKQFFYLFYPLHLLILYGLNELFIKKL